MSKREVYPKEFIEEYLIQQIREIIDENHPYLAFALIASGIEFLGKCLNESKTWDYRNQSGPDIENAIEKLMEKYEEYNLKDELRNGMLHMMKPKSTLQLAYIGHNPNAKHLQKSKSDPNKIVIEVVEFHNDFKSACNEIIRRIENKKFDLDNKIYEPFLNYV